MGHGKEQLDWRASGKNWQTQGKSGSTQGQQGGKGKDNLYNIDGTGESDWWTQCDSTGSEDDLHFCIVDMSKNIATGNKIENSESIVRDGHTWGGIDKNEYLQSVVRDAAKIKDHGEWTNVRVKHPDLRWQHQQRRQNRLCIVRHEEQVSSLERTGACPRRNRRDRGTNLRG